jgi:hypothetical protein
VPTSIQVDQPSLSGATLYATVTVLASSAYAAGQRWNAGTGAFEAVVSGHWADYAVALAEDAGTGHFSGAVPAGINAPALLAVNAYRRAGGAPALSDALVDQQQVNWSGAAPRPPAGAGDAMALTSGERASLAAVVLSDTADTVGAAAVAVRAVTDRLGTALETDGAGGYRFTAAALAHAGAGGLTADAAAETLLLKSVEAGVTVRQALRGVAAYAFGPVTGQGTGTVVYAAAGNPGTPRITAAVGAGGRTSVTPTLGSP